MSVPVGEKAPAGELEMVANEVLGEALVTIKEDEKKEKSPTPSFSNYWVCGIALAFCYS